MCKTLHIKGQAKCTICNSQSLTIHIYPINKGNIFINYCSSAFCRNDLFTFTLFTIFIATTFMLVLIIKTRLKVKSLAAC